MSDSYPAQPAGDGPQAGRESGSGWGTKPRRDPQSTGQPLRDSLLIVEIEGMHSHQCEQAIVENMNAAAGVIEVEVDFLSGQASVLFDARRGTVHQILAAVEAAGYKPVGYTLAPSSD